VSGNKSGKSWCEKTNWKSHGVLFVIASSPGAYFPCVQNVCGFVVGKVLDFSVFFGSTLPVA
jgi:hypothetical protein